MGKIKLNPDIEFVKKLRQGLAENDGYCPCYREHTPEKNVFVKNLKSK